MSIKYLWKNREKPQALSSRWFIVFAKRIITSTKLFRLLINRSIYTFKGVKIGHLSIIDNTPIIGDASKLTIGSSSYIAKDVVLALHAPIIIGNNVVINSGTKLLTGSHDVNDVHWKQYSKKICIDDYAWIASNVIILPGVHIGRGAVIGAGAVVRGHVSPGAIMAGNPAQKIKTRANVEFDYSPVSRTSAFEAWLGK